MTRQSVIFFGTPDFAVPALEALIADSSKFEVRCVVTQPDRPAGRGGATTPPPIKKVALEHKIPVLQPASLKKELGSFLENVKPYGPFEAGVVAAFGQILPTAVLSLPRAGCVNIHASLLPRWRGAAPIHRAILAGDAETGVALMQMEAGLDTGGVFSVTKIPIRAHDNLGILHDALAKAGAALLVRDLSQIIAGSLRAVPQPSEGIAIASKVTNGEAEIQWTQSAAEIDRQVRAFAPMPGAFTFFNGARIKIFVAAPKPDIAAEKKTPGTVVLVDPKRLEVATGSGTLAIEEAQIEGRKRLPIAEFLRGIPVPIGAILGR